MSQHNKTGQEGEDLAAQQLAKKGYTIRHTNWQKDHKELDIVAEKGNKLVVVEVKTRSRNWDSEARDLVPKSKRSNCIRGAQLYLEEFDLDQEVQFDVVLISNDPKLPSFEHIEEAFWPEV